MEQAPILFLQEKTKDIIITHHARMLPLRGTGSFVDVKGPVLRLAVTNLPARSKGHPAP
jgi:hypothetical protein